jgi:hypothetical protein
VGSSTTSLFENDRWQCWVPSCPFKEAKTPNALADRQTWKHGKPPHSPTELGGAAWRAKQEHHHRGRGSVLTEHNGPMPAEWRLRFTAFARATPDLIPLPASTVEAAMATQLWHNTSLGTGRGVLEYGRALTATERTPWLRWARAGLVQLGDLYDANARCYIPLTTLRQTRGLHRHATQEEYDRLQTAVARTPLAPWLRLRPTSLVTGDWVMAPWPTTLTPAPATGTRRRCRHCGLPGYRKPLMLHEQMCTSIPDRIGLPPSHYSTDRASPTLAITAAATTIYRVHPAGWEAHRPQPDARVAHNGQHFQHYGHTPPGAAVPRVDIGGAIPRWVPVADTRALAAEQWSPARYIQARRGPPPAQAAERALVYTPDWHPADSVAGDVVGVGQLRHTAGSLLSHVAHYKPCGHRAVCCLAVAQALAAAAARAVDSRGVSSARRAWLLQGGPRPR